eukprot:8099287-Lingulodinium_polyedra.AAC.1
MQIYVDDPIYALRGVLPTAAQEAAFALLWATVAGFPLAWRKCDGGAGVTWSGASIQVDSGVGA